MVLITTFNLARLVDKLTEEGHTVHRVALLPLEEYDVIMGENACRMVPELVDYCDTTIREVQRRKYGKDQGTQ